MLFDNQVLAQRSIEISVEPRPDRATAGLSFHRQQSTLVIVEEQSLATVLLQQGIDLSILELDDLLLTLVEEAADGRKQSPVRKRGAVPGFV